MTDLLTPRTSTRPGPAAQARGPQRPLWLGAGLAGAASAGSVLVICMALALVGWFASEGGTHGDTRDALRVGADAWLLSLGSPLQLTGTEPTVVSLVPLGLTALGVYVAFRLGRWAAWTSASADLSAVGLGTVVLAGLHAVVALVTAVLAASAAAQASLDRAFVGGLVVGAVGGGLGILAGSGVGAQLTARLPRTVHAVLVGGVSSALLLVAAGSVLVVVALTLDLGTGANVLSRLHAQVPGAALYTVVVAAVAPNAALLGTSYLVGPGFAVGTGTVVSPAAVELGPVPAFPLLAALPDPGPTPAWAGGLLAVPVLVAALATALVARRFPAAGLQDGVVRGLGGGVLGGVLAAVLAGLAGGSVGPGRMSDVGAATGDLVGSAVLAMTVGGVLGGLAMTWWQRSRGERTSYAPDERDGGPDAQDTQDTEDTVRL